MKALQLTKTFPTGFSGEYWVLSETNIDWLQRQAHITLVLYKDAATFLSNPKDGIISTEGFDWSGDDFPFVEGEDVCAAAMNKIAAPKVVDKLNTNIFSAAVPIIAATLLFFFQAACFADNSAREKEIEDQIKTKTEMVQKYQAEISKLYQEGLMLTGALEELKQQDHQDKDKKKK